MQEIKLKKSSHMFLYLYPKDELCIALLLAHMHASLNFWNRIIRISRSHFRINLIQFVRPHTKYLRENHFAKYLDWNYLCLKKSAPIQPTTF